MGLAIDGNVVHGIARGGQAFLPITKNSDGSINFENQTFVSATDTNKTGFFSDDIAHTGTMSGSMYVDVSSDHSHKYWQIAVVPVKSGTTIYSDWFKPIYNKDFSVHGTDEYNDSLTFDLQINNGGRVIWKSTNFVPSDCSIDDYDGAVVVIFYKDF